MRHNLSVSIPGLTLVESNDRYRLYRNGSQGLWVLEPAYPEDDVSERDRRIFTSDKQVTNYLSDSGLNNPQTLSL